jgi:uncharacterized protein (DUF2345 family)
MSQERRTKVTGEIGSIGTGILLAKVVSYVDPEFMGGLEVTLLRNQGNTVGSTQQTYSVKYATPFYGVTGYEYMGLNKSDFTDTQKSYGMWFPTPEIGTTVLVAFAEGDPSQGYFIACVPGRFMNQMIPAIGASQFVELAEADKKRYDTDQPLPVGEVNRKVNGSEKSLEIDKIPKPVHPIADRFLEQGLLEDDVRGPAQSSSRRSVPNTVFGISTPGPVDRSTFTKKEFVGKKEGRTASPIPVGRTGGTQIVMDDGNDRFLRVSPASLGPIDYVDNLNPKETRTGNTDIPYGEHFRIRTRTGHQILMHNSEDLIYIGNAKGTTWIELTSNGKIDIYAQDSISIHTEADFNFRADRDVNIEAGRNINMRTAGGRLHADVNGNLEFVVSGNNCLTTLGDLDIRTTGSSRLSSGSNLDISTRGSNTFTCTAEFDLSAGGALVIDATGTVSAKGADIIMQGDEIHLNGPGALSTFPADEAKSAQTLTLYDNPATSSDEKWGDKNRYKLPDYLRSIMRRIPMHEPWPLHENFNPTVLADILTDRDPLPSTVKEEEVKNAGTSTSATTATPPSGQSTEVLAGTGTELPEEGASPAPGGPENATTEESGTKLSPEQENAKLAADLAQAETRLTKVDENYKSLRLLLDKTTEKQVDLRLQAIVQARDPAALATFDRLLKETQEIYNSILAQIRSAQSEADSLKSKIRDLKAQIAATK